MIHRCLDMETKGEANLTRAHILMSFKLNLRPGEITQRKRTSRADKRAKFQAQGTSVELTKGDGAQLTEKEKQPHKESQEDVAS